MLKKQIETDTGITLADARHRVDEIIFRVAEGNAIAIVSCFADADAEDAGKVPVQRMAVELSGDIGKVVDEVYSALMLHEKFSGAEQLSSKKPGWEKEKREAAESKGAIGVGR